MLPQRLQRPFAGIALAVGAAGLAGPAVAQTYTQFDVPGAANTVALDLDDSSRVVGFTFGVGTASAFVTPDRVNYDVFTGPGTPTFTTALGTNNAGLVVGRSNGSGVNRGFVRSADGTFAVTDLAPPNATRAFAYGITDDGATVVGEYDDSVAGRSRGFVANLSDPSAITYAPIDVPGATNTFVRKINNAGLMVGFYTDATGRNRGFTTADGLSFATIDVPGSRGTIVHGLNDLGQLVGEYGPAGTTGFTARGFFTSDGMTFTDLEFPGVDVSTGGLTIARDINNAGVVVGQFRAGDATVPQHGFITSAIPEPASVGLLAAAGIGLLRRNRRN